MNIVTGPDGQQYVEFNGVAMVPNTGSVYTGRGIFTAPDPYTAAKMFEMRGAMWDERAYGFTSYTPPGILPPPPPEPPNRFQHLDWEEGAA